VDFTGEDDVEGGGGREEGSGEVQILEMWVVNFEEMRENTKTQNNTHNHKPTNQPEKTDTLPAQHTTLHPRKHTQKSKERKGGKNGK